MTDAKEAHKDTRKAIIKKIEQECHEKWERKQIFRAVVPEDLSKPKFFVNFPYPYMNGKLHLGHAFSFSKAEFAARYHRMKGEEVLLPFGLHVTGMPIAAAAKKLQTEMANFGTPPIFPVEDSDKPATKASNQAKEADKVTSGKFVGRKGKKAVGRPQWAIMKEMGLTDEQIPAFSEPNNWLDFFPPMALEDLRAFGAHVDYRRSFITTERNPYYDSFIKWQFRKLKAQNKLSFGKRFTIFSTAEGQPCLDHDRTSGEGVLPQEYTGIKMQVQNPLDQECFQQHAVALAGKHVFLIAATLRPETMFGQTNCWIQIDGEYIGFEIIPGEVFIATARAALNMAYQEIGPLHAGQEPPALFTISGREMLGLPLFAPNAPFPTVYVLPMTTVSTTKGTGVVTSVPSDSPDDYTALMELKNKPEWRKQLGVKDEWIMPFEAVPIIEIPELGNLAAPSVVKSMGIVSQKEQEKLADAKAQVYLKGFNFGKMIVAGEFNGAAVKDCKPVIRRRMIEAGQAISYSEPESLVIGRSGDECIVALVDQWYLAYGEDQEWKGQVKRHATETLNTYTDAAAKAFREAADWLGDWACSRTFGLGTRLPVDGTINYVIDSLSDSTIYMAYYTIAHYLQGGGEYNNKTHSEDGSHLNLDGSKPSPAGIKPEQLTDAVWDYILLGTPENVEDLDTTIDRSVLKQMHREFNYWYPFDLRCSGKDLITNHMTMSVYNHAAIFPERQWPRSMYCNGHIMVDGQKMSKSLGNFLLWSKIVDEWGADPVRITLADSGDGLDDANFVQQTVNATVLRLTKELDWMKETVEHSKQGKLRTGPLNVFDRIFENDMNHAIVQTDRHFGRMMFRDGLNTGLFLLSNNRDAYRQYVANQLHHDVILRYIEVQALLIAPIAPHFAEHVWSDILGRPGTVVTAAFPTPSQPVDISLLMSSKYIDDSIREFRAGVEKQKKKGTKPTHGVLYVTTQYKPWQVLTTEWLQRLWEKTEGQLPKELNKHLDNPELQKQMKFVMGFAAYIRELAIKYGQIALASKPLVNEWELLGQATDFIRQSLEVPNIQLARAEDDSVPDPAKVKVKSEVGKPTGHFWAE
eukprot:TRINITY_DN8766_c0_g1_i1.p1 TRINITY_DN8766_c0_g1~~TRINITY_DN8766_c0_g1_i1.p1  ORF type:complete len:1087 (-),score=221.84 TRINITY_DN8766_c0_g1_i1:64-3324(-)